MSLKDDDIHQNVVWVDVNILRKQYRDLDGKRISIFGWIRSNRNNGTVGFIAFNDGTSFGQVQIVYKKNISDFDNIKKLNTGCSILVTGTCVLTPQAEQEFEIQADSIQILKKAENYPIQKNYHSDEFLRQNAHLRARTNKYQAIMRIRSELAHSINLFFRNNGFINLHSPIITSVDPEGAGETFELKDDPSKPYWPKKALLTVSGQFAAEAYAQAFKRVYTFGPTFRAEKSHTSRHLAEFWMVEAEIAFVNLNQLINIIEGLIKHSIVYLKENTKDELKFCSENIDKTLLEKLNNLIKNPFKKIEYIEALNILQDAVKKNKVQFENNEIYWGMDINSECEQYLCKFAFGYSTPVFVYNFPKESKAFYMKINEDQKTVAAVDLLMPDVGELCGGSQREDDKAKLIKRCCELKMDLKKIEWYLNLRDYGYHSSSGFGLGFDRFVTFVTGLDNLKDAIPFPRAHGLLDF